MPKVMLPTFEGWFDKKKENIKSSTQFEYMQGIDKKIEPIASLIQDVEPKLYSRAEKTLEGSSFTISGR